MDRDCCLQKSSSWKSNSFISPFSFLMSPMLLGSFWETSTSKALCLSRSFVLEFPKVFCAQATNAILHALIFLKIQNIGLPDGAQDSHDCQIIFSQSRWEAHFSSKCFGILFLWFYWCGLWVVSIIGTWSEYEDCTCVTLPWGKISLHSRLAST